jgi:hypothetical protein
MIGNDTTTSPLFPLRTGGTVSGRGCRGRRDRLFTVIEYRRDYDLLSLQTFLWS